MSNDQRTEIRRRASLAHIKDAWRRGVQITRSEYQRLQVEDPDFLKRFDRLMKGVQS